MVVASTQMTVNNLDAKVVLICRLKPNSNDNSAISNHFVVFCTMKSGVP